MRPDDAASVLRRARLARRTLAPFTDEHPTLTRGGGMVVDAEDVAQRLDT